MRCVVHKSAYASYFSGILMLDGISLPAYNMVQSVLAGTAIYQMSNLMPKKIVWKAFSLLKP